MSGKENELEVLVLTSSFGPRGPKLVFARSDKPYLQGGTFSQIVSSFERAPCRKGALGFACDWFRMMVVMGEGCGQRGHRLKFLV